MIITETVSWEPGGWSFSSDTGITKRSSFNKVSIDQFPALLQKAEELKKEGFSLTDGQFVRVMRTEIIRNDLPSEFNFTIRDVIFFRNETTSLGVNVFNYSSEIHKLADGIIITHQDLYHLGDPIESGKGQLNKCKEIALGIFLKHGHLLPENNVICVEYKTRGGKGGWARKIAQRRFYRSELEQIKE